jgi:D-3-phosphoglycerate dehydrogenase
MNKVGVTYNHAFPVDVDVVRNVVGGAATVIPVEVPGWALSEGEEAAFIEQLSGLTAVLQRPGTFSRRVLSSLPELTHIAVHGAGYDKIDLDAAREFGVSVTNAPGANAVAVAELVMGLVVMMARNLPEATFGVAGGAWGEVRKTGVELMGKRFGILGVGHVGSEVATRARALGFEVVAFDPAYSAADFEKMGIAWLPSDEVIGTSDILTLHVPLDSSTRHLLSKRTFALMKRGSYFLNLSRGPVVDESALEEALISGHIRFAALDVREKEPPLPDDRLRRMPNVISSPHIGGSTDGALRRIAQICAEEILRGLSGEPFQWQVN